MVFIGYHNYYMWFLRNLIIYVFVIPIFYPLLKRKVIGLAIVVTLSIFGLLVDFSYLRYGTFYIFGTTIIGFLRPEQVHMIYIPLRLTQAVAIWLAADVLACKRKPAWWITISFIIYCSQTIILTSIKKVILWVWGDSLTGALMNLMLALLFTINIIIIGSIF